MIKIRIIYMIINKDIFFTNIYELKRHLYLSYLLEDDAVHPRAVSNEPKHNPP